MIHGERNPYSMRGDKSKIMPFFSHEAIRIYYGKDFTNLRTAAIIGLNPEDAAPAGSALGGAGGPPKPRRGGGRTKTRRSRQRSYHRRQTRK